MIRVAPKKFSVTILDKVDEYNEFLRKVMTKLHSTFQGM